MAIAAAFNWGPMQFDALTRSELYWWADQADAITRKRLELNTL